MTYSSGFGRCTRAYSFRRDLRHVDGLSRPQRRLGRRGFAFNKVLQTFWTGAKYSIPDEWLRGWGALDLAAALYYQTQNNWNFTWRPGNQRRPLRVRHATPARGPANSSAATSAAAARTRIGFLADWRPVKRVDIFAGVLITNVYGGLANGYFQQPNCVVARKTSVNSQVGAHPDLRPDDRHPRPVLIHPTPELAENVAACGDAGGLFA